MNLFFALMTQAFAENDSWERCYPKGYGTEAWCQTLQAPLHSNSSKTIELAIVKLPAIRPSPKADPLFFIAGGPGQSAIDSIALASPSLRSIQKTRDIFFVDQRGTGGSSPIQCATPELKPEDWDSEHSQAQYSASMIQCLQQLEHPIEYFGTAYAVQDIEFVRQHLGLQELNLYGISYGTRVAQVYMRQFPAHTRSVILDGVVPMNEPIGLHFKAQAQSVLDQIDQDCAQDRQCQALTPSVKSDLQEIINHLSTDSTVYASHPTSGIQTEYQLTPKMVLSGVRLALYSTLLQRLLPYTLHEAAHQNHGPLLAQTIQPALRLEESISSGLYYAIYCAEDHPRLPQDTEVVSDLMDGLDANEAQAICQQLELPAIEADFFEPISSDIPVLILSGARDPITPPALAEKASIHLSAHQHIVAPQAAHNVGLERCASGLMGRFIDSPQQTATSDCIENAEAKPWIIHTAGAQP